MGVVGVSERAIRQNPVQYIDSSLGTKQDYMKIINYDVSVAKAKGRFNRIGITTAESPIRPGDLVSFDDALHIVASRIPDIYRGRIVRYVCELFFCDVKTVVRRRTLTKSQFDVVTGSVDTTVWAELPVSWQVSDIFVKGVRDLETEYYNACYSVHHEAVKELKKEDVLMYYGKKYEIKFFRRDLPGIISARVEPVTA
jgi:hypothetical protein